MCKKSPTPFNLEESLMNLGGDKDIFNEIAEMFFDESKELMEQLSEAIGDIDSQNIMKTAHAIKGMVGNFAAHSTFATAYRLEKMGRDHNLENAPAVFALLETQINELRDALSAALQNHHI